MYEWLIIISVVLGALLIKNFKGKQNTVKESESTKEGSWGTIIAGTILFSFILFGVIQAMFGRDIGRDLPSDVQMFHSVSLFVSVTMLTLFTLARAEGKKESKIVKVSGYLSVLGFLLTLLFPSTFELFTGTNSSTSTSSSAGKKFDAYNEAYSCFENCDSALRQCGDSTKNCYKLKDSCDRSCCRSYKKYGTSATQLCK